MTPRPLPAQTSSAPLPQDTLAAHYRACFERHGRTPQGVDWPNAADLATRFEVMLGVVREPLAGVSILDLGCGPGLLLDHLAERGGTQEIDYVGIDLNEAMLRSARERWPERRFLQHDILRAPLAPGSCDYVLMNGVLTERRGVPRDAMAAYAVELLAAAFATARKGVAFNVMSRLVDWERDDLFHWGFEEMAAAVAPRLSRHLVLRADYGLYEYTAYVYREPCLRRPS